MSNSSASRGRLPASRRRRPALASLALLLIVVGALGSALLVYRSGSRVEALVVSRDIAVGERIEAGDLRTTRVAASESTSVLESRYRQDFVGSFASVGIPEGTLVNARMFQVGDVIPRGSQLVGMVVDLARRTTQSPERGDVVRVYYVGQDGGEPPSGLSRGDAAVEAARVMQVGGSTAQGTSLTVLVRDDRAGPLAELAANGSLAVTVLPDATRPEVDTATPAGSE